MKRISDELNAKVDIADIEKIFATNIRNTIETIGLSAALHSAITNGRSYEIVIGLLEEYSETIKDALTDFRNIEPTLPTQSLCTSPLNDSVQLHRSRLSRSSRSRLAVKRNSPDAHVSKSLDFSMIECDRKASPRAEILEFQSFVDDTIMMDESTNNRGFMADISGNIETTIHRRSDSTLSFGSLSTVLSVGSDDLRNLDFQIEKETTEFAQLLNGGSSKENAQQQNSLMEWNRIRRNYPLETFVNDDELKTPKPRKNTMNSDEEMTPRNIWNVQLRSGSNRKVKIRRELQRQLNEDDVECKVGGTGLAIIWSSVPLESHKSKTDKSGAKSLCQIRLQAGANCCRWSMDGTKFAIGSDDSSVSVYTFLGRVNSAGSVLGTSGGSVERYKECAMLRTHNMEVLCVEWSPNGKYLASSSMDNTICIWNAKNFHEKIAVLRGHDSAVKGISFDPIGKYLASLSADKSLKLWQTDNWQCHTTITKPFEGSSQTTMFSRLDWTPDGKYLLAPTATNNDGPTVQIIERQTWSIERDLVGHRKATTCVRVLPRIMCYLHKNKKIQVSCIAVGSRDRAISVWLIPGLDRPVLAITHLFKHSVMDLSWCDNTLYACSQDGTIAVLSFKESEIGQALTSSAMSDLCYKSYCLRPPQYEGNSSMAVDDETNGFTGHDSSFNNSFVTCPEDVIARRKKEEEEKKKNAEEPNGKSKPVEDVPKKDDVKANECILIKERSKQVEERKDGKRRIQPIFLGSTCTDEPSSSIKSAAAQDIQQQQAKRRRIDEEDGESLESSSSEEDEEEEEMEVSGDDRTSSKKKTKQLDNKQSKILAVDFKKPTLRPIEQRTMKITEGTVVMDAPEPQSAFLQPVLNRKNFHLDIDNKWKHGGVEVTSVRLVKRKTQPPANHDSSESNAAPKQINDQVWMIVVPSPVIVAAANKNYCIFGCGDRCLRIYRLKCATNIACLLLDSIPISVGIREHAAYALTECGKLSTWDLRKPTVVVNRQPIFECVVKDSSLSTLDISERGVPLMSFSNGAVYTYGLEFGCWERVDLTTQMYRLTTFVDAKQFPDGPLGRLLKKARNNIGSSPNVAINVSRSIKEAQLHQWLHCADMLGNAQDYKGILAIYVEHLCEHGNEEKLRTVLDQLSSSVTPICGLRRGALRDDVAKMIEARHPVIAARLLTSYSSDNLPKKTSLF
ncbi:unnamed protein product [Caenorhabditis bovis]|uniref:Protein HIRA n=1 Tax=Caenorhabditis bovis TaxID=2654633 RepID=A0A8S1ER93_9PELO|nr:unnamed protein product [Caenorhabditis bovis]